MEYDFRLNTSGDLVMTITMSQDEVNKLGYANSIQAFGKTDYCVTCHGGRTYTIETYGDIAANIEAAATCYKEVGNPSYSLRKGSCS